MHQFVVLENGLDGFQVVIGVHVEHGVVLVVELAVGLGAGVVALDQVLEVVIVAAGVAVRVHGHKAGVLQKTRVHAPSCAGEVLGHAVDHVVLEPLKATVRRQVVHRSRGFAGVDGAAHHGHRQRRGFATAGHQGHGCQHGHGGLAHADDMAVAIDALQVADELLHVIHVVVEVELTLGQGDQPGILPVGDVDLVVLEHGAHGVAQQSGVVPRQGRHDQHHRLGLELGQGGGVVRETLEAAQFAERLVHLDAFVHRYTDAVHIHRMDLESGLFVVLAQAIQQFVARRHALRQRAFAEGGHGVAEQLGSSLREIGKGLHQGALGFVDVIQHGRNSVMLQCNITALRNKRMEENHQCQVTYATDQGVSLRACPISRCQSNCY
ncbi:hypothetical protein D3C71_1200840 [compost metagenome]